MLGYRALDEGTDPLFLGMLAASFAVRATWAGRNAGRCRPHDQGREGTILGRNSYRDLPEQLLPERLRRTLRRQQ